ncbi:unnamed protein product [Prunus armeniaca]
MSLPYWKKSLAGAKRIGSIFLSHHIHPTYFSSPIIKVTRHQALSFSMGGKEARRSMSTVSLMLWDHMLVIIVSDLGNFQRALPIVLTHERVTTTQLNNTRQKHGEDPVDFVRKFQDLALDCYDEKDEEALVEICISNIMVDYRVYLENIGISQFSRLLEAVRKTSISVKLNG